MVEDGGQRAYEDDEGQDAEGEDDRAAGGCLIERERRAAEVSEDERRSCLGRSHEGVYAVAYPREGELRAGRLSSISARANWRASPATADAPGEGATVRADRPSQGDQTD